MLERNDPLIPVIGEVTRCQDLPRGHAGREKAV